MNKAALAAVAVVAVLSCPLAAAAQEQAEPIKLAHKGQFGAHLQLGTGYRVLFPYNEEFCGQVDKAVCTGRSPAYMEVGLSFGVTNSLELLGEARFGLETDFTSLAGADGPRPVSFSAGVRLFVDPDGKLKFYSTLQGVVETTDYSGSAGTEQGADFGLKNVNGIQLDLHRTFGLYAHFGETASFKTWLRFELHGGVGLQVRFP